MTPLETETDLTTTTKRTERHSKVTSKSGKSPHKKKRASFDRGKETGYWKTNGPDAILLVKTLRDPNDTRLTVGTSKDDVVIQYGDLCSRWGARRLADNWEKIEKNYRLWKAGEPRKMCFTLVFVCLFTFPNL